MHSLLVYPIIVMVLIYSAAVVATGVMLWLLWRAYKNFVPGQEQVMSVPIQATDDDHAYILV